MSSAVAIRLAEWKKIDLAGKARLLEISADRAYGALDAKQREVADLAFAAFAEAHNEAVAKRQSAYNFDLPAAAIKDAQVLYALEAMIEFRLVGELGFPEKKFSPFHVAMQHWNCPAVMNVQLAADR
jgi:hypothetical protein